MTKRNLTKIGTAILKWIAVATALLNLPELQEALGENATWAATGFAAASALKDTLVTVLDYLDDGKANNSFNFPGKTLGLLMIVGLGFLLLPSCGGTWGVDSVTGHLGVGTDHEVIIVVEGTSGK